ncbi:MAG: PmoA family protein, partial [Pyrinomonadaceae bacterium]|nr:PmoA family protein [Pyrinomonadaceae bacterium]
MSWLASPIAASFGEDGGGIPAMQAVPQPYDQVSLQRDEREIARFHYGPALNRPFVYPVIGPSGRTLTRMGHPGDPHSHSHHNSVWVSYSSVNGVDFWSDHRADRGRIVVREVTELEDGNDRAGIITKGAWIDPAGKTLVREQRETWVYRLEDRQLLLVIDLKLDAAAGEVTFEKAGFGPVGVRVAKWMSAHFGDGRITNSAGGEGEPATFRKPARWMDYSGSVASGVREGLTLMDHPMNPGHPSPFHVREDGWMGAMLSTERPTIIG